MALKRHTLVPGLWKPQLLLGGDRSFMIMLGIFSFILIFFVKGWIGWTLGPVLFWFGRIFLVKKAEQDPQYFKVLGKHLFSQAYYPAGAIYPGAPKVYIKYFNPYKGYVDTGIAWYWRLFYFIFRNSDRGPKNEMEGE